MLGAVGGAVVLLVGDEGGQAAELDVAQAAEARRAVLDRGHGGEGGRLRRGGGDRRRRHNGLGGEVGGSQRLRHR